MIERQHGDVGERRCHGGTRVGALGRRVGVGVCLDRTFQDEGGQLVEIVDEDPAQRWLPPGGQFCDKIGGIVVLLGDVMQLDPLEFVLEPTHLLAVCHHEGAFTGGLLHDLVNDQL